MPGGKRASLDSLAIPCKFLFSSLRYEEWKPLGPNGTPLARGRSRRTPRNTLLVGILSRRLGQPLLARFPNCFWKLRTSST